MIQLVIPVSLVIYLLFYFWDRRHLKDEREQLIELKASDLQSRCTLVALIALAAYYWWDPSIPVWVCLLVLNAANLYSEIVGKIYWRSRL